MKKKGFTLIELVVVIAIIGVLAAILVPAMMGYVKKSKITSTNTMSKSLYNAMNSAMIEMASIDIPPRKLQGDFQTQGSVIIAQENLDIGTAPHATKADMEAIFYKKIDDYFPDVAKIQDICYRISGEGCKGVGVVNGYYPGTFPIAITINDYDDFCDAYGQWTSKDALEFALNDTVTITP